VLTVAELLKFSLDTVLGGRDCLRQCPLGNRLLNLLINKGDGGIGCPTASILDPLAASIGRGVLS